MTAKMPKHWKVKVNGIPRHQLWSLNDTLLRYILPRIRAFRDMKPMGYPGSIDETEWERILNDMVDGFELMKIGLDCSRALTQREWKQVVRAKSLFAKWWLALWD